MSNEKDNEDNRIKTDEKVDSASAAAGATTADVKSEDAEKVVGETSELKAEEVKEKPPEVRKEVEKKGLWGILHIYSSQNNTILHVTDMSGAETICIKYGGQMVKADKDKASPYASMKAVGKIAEIIRDRGIEGLDVKVRAPGGHQGPAYPGKGAQAAIRQLSRVGIPLGKIEDATPVAHGGCRPKKRRRI